MHPIESVNYSLGNLLTDAHKVVIFVAMWITNIVK